MISVDSPFRNIPRNLDSKQAFFLDGMRHAAEICDLSYNRLTAGLHTISLKNKDSPPEQTYSLYFLDAWAFVDAADRLRCLWALQPNASSVPEPFSPDTLRREFSSIRKIRNIADHIAQRADHIVSLNAAALGILAWVSLISQTPLLAKTCIIRPGFAKGSFDAQFSIPSGDHKFINLCTDVRIHAGNEFADLTRTRESIAKLIAYAESHLRVEFAKSIYMPASPADILATAELNFDTSGSAT